MKKLNNFEIKIPMLLMGGGIPLKGYAFYVSFDNETYYGAEFDKMRIISCLRITDGTQRYYDYHTVIYFHCEKGNFSAEFYKGENGDAVFVGIKDADKDKELLIPISFYANRNAIENGKAMRMSFGNDIVSFNELPFFDMQADEQDKGTIVGKTYCNNKNVCVYINSVPINEFDVESLNDKLVATNLRFGEDADLEKCFATKEECMMSIHLEEMPRRAFWINMGGMYVRIE